MPSVTLKTSPAYGLPLGLAYQRYKSLILSIAGLVLYWRLNEVSGTTATDLSSGAHNGTYNNSPALGQVGPIANDATSTAVLLNKASSQTITNSAFTGPSSFTMMCWAKAGALPQSPGILVHTGTTGNGGGFGIGGSNDGTSSGLVWLNSGSGWVDLSYTWPDTSSWHFIVVTGSSGTGRLYVDGTQAGGTFLAFISNPSAGSGMQVGGETASARMATATITEVAIFNRPLSAGEISTLYRIATKGV